MIGQRGDNSDRGESEGQQREVVCGSGSVCGSVGRGEVRTRRRPLGAGGRAVDAQDDENGLPGALLLLPGPDVRVPVLQQQRTAHAHPFHYLETLSLQG